METNITQGCLIEVFVLRLVEFIQQVSNLTMYSVFSMERGVSQLR